MKSIILIAAMSIGTILLRFLPFLIIRKETPPYIAYLGRVLPPAIIGMLVIYCLKDVKCTEAPFGLQVWRRNSLLSILAGTILYMFLTQMVF